MQSYIIAHPGRTDANGGHTCRTNCDDWGYSYGSYHYHGGVPAPVITPKPVQTATPTLVITTPSPKESVARELLDEILVSPSPTAMPVPIQSNNVGIGGWVATALIAGAVALVAFKRK